MTVECNVQITYLYIYYIYFINTLNVQLIEFIYL